MTEEPAPRRASEARVDPLTGATTVIVGSRQGRPNLPAAGCPFCPGGLEAPAPYDTFWFVNRWPAMPDDRCEMVLYTPQHDATFWSLGVDGARRVVDLWADRTAALGGRPDIAYVLVFENRGPEVGATIAHPHGQIYAFDVVPDVPRRELERAAELGCPLCAEQPGARLVARSEGWRAWVPHASSYPYGLVMAPEAHLPDLPGLDDPGRAALAALLVDVLARLDRLFDAPLPYMLWIHQRPTDGAPWPQAHLHLELVSPYRAAGVQRFVAAGELGSGMFFNPVVPEDAAEQLRGLGP
ncbi:MAG: galactose-1-phosphate uridylyltransferase [Acidimicrobiales bacterium]|nr:galactose-1-phosphate uridylyltransferase [Acidimicrobiales bacterium]